MSIISAGGAVVGAGGPSQYEIERSLRFNSADSAYLNRTFGTATDRKKWTLSVWAKFKNKTTSERQVLLDAGAQSMIGLAYGTDWAGFHWYDQTAGTAFYGTRLYRDSNAWMHIFVVYDSTQAIAIDRIKVYANNVQDHRGVVDDIALNAVSDINSANAHSIGRSVTYSQYLDGYLAEYYFIDGQALTPTDFGEFNTDTGVWQPKEYTGSYGTNGFYLNFSDNASTTTLGDDLSGNGNDWTTNNFSVTAGADNDSLVDTPTNYGEDTGVGGEVRGNYATMNPLQYSSTYAVLSNGNLNVAGASGVDAGGAFATAKVNSEKWYWEALILGTASTYPFLGFAVNTTGAEFQGGARIGTAGTPAIVSPESFITLNGSPSGTSFTTNDVLQFALDMDNGKMWIGKNGTWMNSGVPASGTGNMFSISDTSQYVSPYIFSYDTSSVAFNFGQRAFFYTAPSGFKALVTQNLPEPTVVQGDDYFNTVLWTGNSTASQAVTGVGFQPDLVWAKSRPANSGQNWVDSVRGATKNIRSNSTDAEATANTVISFQSDGFTVGDGLGYDINKSGESVVGWCWKANGSGVSNTDGTITSTVSVSTTSGFSIVSYTGTGVNATVGHGLGVAPRMIIIKERNNSGQWWQVGHASADPAWTKVLYLNVTDAISAASATFWNNTAPTSTVFSIGTNVQCNRSTGTYVAYCFAAIPGYSAFGSYTGNGSADGPFVYTGFRPAFVMAKAFTFGSVQDWFILDAGRNPFNVADDWLEPNTSDAEGSQANSLIDFVSNGFKFRGDMTMMNFSGYTYIYAAFAENPFKYSLAR
jgi:hypothetical protein